MFKHPKMRNLTQTLLNEISYKTHYLFIFGLLKYWKILFEIPYQTSPKIHVCIEKKSTFMKFYQTPKLS